MWETSGAPHWSTETLWVPQQVTDHTEPTSQKVTWRPAPEIVRLGGQKEEGEEVAKLSWCKKSHFWLMLCFTFWPFSPLSPLVPYGIKRQLPGGPLKYHPRVTLSKSRGCLWQHGAIGPSDLHLFSPEEVASGCMTREEPNALAQSHTAPRKEMDYWVDPADFDFPVATSSAGLGPCRWHHCPAPAAAPASTAHLLSRFSYLPRLALQDKNHPSFSHLLHLPLFSCLLVSPRCSSLCQASLQHWALSFSNLCLPFFWMLGWGDSEWR